MARLGARGFTLLEVLVAVAIFALIGLAAAALLARILDARALVAERADRLQDIQRAVARLERDLVQHSLRPIRDAYGDGQPALALDLDGVLELTVQGWRNPLQLPRSEQQRVRWRLTDDGVLERSFWVVLDRAQDSEAVPQQVLEDLGAFEVEIIASDGGSFSQWPVEDADALAPAPLPVAADPDAPGAASGSANGAPVAIALRFALDAPPFGRIERLLELPEQLDLDADADGDGADAAPADDSQDPDAAPAEQGVSA